MTNKAPSTNAQEEAPMRLVIGACSVVGHWVFGHWDFRDASVFV